MDKGGGGQFFANVFYGRPLIILLLKALLSMLEFRSHYLLFALFLKPRIGPPSKLFLFQALACITKVLKTSESGEGGPTT